MQPESTNLIAFYRRYLEHCNEHRFDGLDEFVDPAVRVNGTRQGLNGYAAGLRAVVDAFPDYRWDLQQAIVDGSWLAARLTGTGTHTGTFLGVAATERSISIQELAMYRLASGRIVESWGDLASTVRDQLTSGVLG